MLQWIHSCSSAHGIVGQMVAQVLNSVPYAYGKQTCVQLSNLFELLQLAIECKYFAIIG